MKWCQYKNIGDVSPFTCVWHIRAEARDTTVYDSTKYLLTESTKWFQWENVGDVFPLAHTHAEIRDTIVLNSKNAKYTRTERLRLFQ